ncbi:Nuclear rim protein 1 [Clydaea vesicula]|uniref:Nuclear rim protein 1 n=1 Tax=Clydaea vesicula TaxID=447962 RepID=A0AAD5TTB8_9FUNG|nr:Nuclear rim protein 1 [Clydaea vesicula]
MPPKKIKKQSLLSKLKSYPSDLLILFSENILTLQWESLQLNLSLTACLVFNLFFISSKLIYCFQIADEGDREMWGIDYFYINFMHQTLFAFSIFTFMVLITSSKNYFLLHHNTEPEYEDDVSWIINSRNAKLCLVDMNNEVLNTGMVNYIFLKLSKADVVEKVEKRWKINIWNPSVWSKTVFKFFSPIQVLCLYSIDSFDNFYTNSFLALMISLTLFVVFLLYDDLLKDQQILHKEFVSEFTNKFVYKQDSFKLKCNATTATDNEFI